METHKALSNREAQRILVAGSVISGLVVCVFLLSVPPVQSFFEGLGMLLALYLLNGFVVWVGHRHYLPGQEVGVQSVFFGALLTSFFGTLIGLVLVFFLDFFI